MRPLKLEPLLLVAVAGLLAAFQPDGRVPRVSVEVKDADVHDVVRLFAEVGGVNVVIPDHVTGRVTLSLHDVPWTEALDAVLRSRRLGRITEGQIIYVDTLERLAAADRSKLARREASERLAPMITRIIPVRYARAEDLVAIVEPLLSEQGRVVADRRTNVLVVTDRLDVLAPVVVAVSGR